jgi:xylulose-5-phosphate/fructose-6-phosphate phosphoketolase
MEAMVANVLSNNERTLINAYWRAANYLSVGQIYLYDNPLLKQTLTKDHIKPRLLGHWGLNHPLIFIESFQCSRVGLPLITPQL